MAATKSQQPLGPVSGDQAQPFTAAGFCDSSTLKRVLFLIAMFFFTTFTPAARIENSFLMQAFALRGVHLPSRKQLYNEYLDTCYAHYHDIFLDELKEFNGVYQIATDGWKKKAAERGISSLPIAYALLHCTDLWVAQSGLKAFVDNTVMCAFACRHTPGQLHHLVPRRQNKDVGCHLS